jgi:glycosyltransferase involved in cell wall biosynthesis
MASRRTLQREGVVARDPEAMVAETCAGLMREAAATPACLNLVVSIIVPVHNNPSQLRLCLGALQAAAKPDSEIIVVDDASTDETAAVATDTGARVVALPSNSGPAAARNHGAAYARGDVLFFVDADVVVAPGAIERVRGFFAGHPEYAAVFGSYDARPACDSPVSRYRNLLHHFVHQRGTPEASTFWAGCGAIRRSVFEVVGGFDAARFRRPSIEDIDLGYRLRAAGHRIRLDPGLQGTHLKRWTLGSIVRTDIACRALPWSRLILSSGHAPRDLNLATGQRVSAALVGLAAVSAPLGLLRVDLLALPALALLAVAILNRALYAFFRRQGGTRVAAVGIALHLLYYLYSGLTYLYARLEHDLRGMAPAVRTMSRTARQ